MPHSLKLRSAELSIAISSRRVSILLPIIAMLSTVAFMALFELLKGLLFPSITLWQSHLITIVGSGIISTVISLFVFNKFRAIAESYRKLVEQFPDAVLIHHQGRILFANRACVSLFGASSSGELLGRQMFDFVHPDDREAVRKRIREHAHNFTSVRHSETRLTGLNGKETCTEVMAC